jgi:hypothetical protein
MALVPANNNNARNVVANLARGAAIAANPAVREMVQHAGRRLRSAYDSLTQPRKPQQPQQQQRQPKQRSQPKPRNVRRNTRPRNINAGPSGINPQIEYKRANGSKPYRTGFQREKVLDVTGTTTPFAIIAEYAVNPGNTLLFPLGSQMAQMFEQYHVSGGYIRMCYETTSYTAVSGSTNAGVVVMSTNIDPGDRAPLSLSQMENSYSTTRCPPYATRCVHNIPVSHLFAKNMFINYAANSTVTNTTSFEPKFYDVGTFRLACANNASTSIIGELWVEYDLTLIRRKMPGPTGFASRFIRLSEFPANTAAALSIGGSGGFSTYAGHVGNLNYEAGVNSITINEMGTFLITVSCKAGSGIGGYPLFTNGASITLVTAWDNNTSTSAGAFSATESTLQAIFNVTSISGTKASRTLTFTGPSGMLNGSTDVIVIMMPSAPVLDHTRIQRPEEPPTYTIEQSTQRLLDTERRMHVMLEQALAVNKKQAALINDITTNQTTSSWDVICPTSTPINNNSA